MLPTCGRTTLAWRPISGPRSQRVTGVPMHSSRVMFGAPRQRRVQELLSRRGRTVVPLHSEKEFVLDVITGRESTCACRDGEGFRVVAGEGKDRGGGPSREKDMGRGPDVEELASPPPAGGSAVGEGGDAPDSPAAVAPL
uniref:Uncharacterized protein n=1 Tax=Chromera velia CCMP2878 TaxID=1169474 RepID=A0A0G4GSB8_9ALVE|eukprot:Cvel_23172.t1-p1 / transcript=Cvel_23172.t1 / gene=Cvel_23172 / organism=Chromera_velia_CCMP2878 / gene_product=hypothetical protein / transcript_product=hypothetical protein / location=Cvel_scaffold2359:17762-21306(+) / protein_length=139 / sequence_SO=supercontig / SO=protein_coding / is_pseudo=false